MTFATMYADVLDRLHQSGTTATTRAKGFLNRAYEDVQTRWPWYWLEQTTATVNTVASQAYVDLAATCAYLLPGTLRTTNQALQPCTTADIYDYDPDRSETGEPTHYATGAYQANATTALVARMHLFPIPDAVYVLSYLYNKLATALSADSDIPALPSNFHEVLVLGAQWRGEKYLPDVNPEITRRDYEQRIVEMIRHNSSVVGDVPLRVSKVWWDDYGK